jgi:hypothetical protein
MSAVARSAKTQNVPLCAAVGPSPKPILGEHNGGYARGCYRLVDHALRSASAADVLARRHHEHPRPSAWR